MKKILLLVAVVLSSTSYSQTTIFQENWDGQGPGIAAWTLHNVDGKTPVGPTGTDGEPLSFLVQAAWTQLSLTQITGATPAFTAYPPGATGMSDNVVASNSWYNPVGAADDWLVSPLITIPTTATGVTLKWAANSMGDTSFLEDYQIYASPTGGNQVVNFSTLLLNVPNELSTGSYRTLSLQAYAGQSIRIAFRNNGNDQYVMFLDNISVTSTNLSTDDFNSNRFLVSPNPVKNIVTLSNLENLTVSKVVISDLNGRVIKEINGNSLTKLDIDLSNLDTGMYIMAIDSNLGKTTKKIIKE